MFKYFITIALMLIVGEAFSQSTDLLAEGVEKQLEISGAASVNSADTRQVLMLAARAMAKSTDQTILHYTVKEHRTINKTGNRLQIYLSIGNYVFNDEVSYQKFAISSFLKPSLISYTWVWEDGDGNELEKKTVKDQVFKNGAYLVKKSIEDVYNKSSYKLYMTNISFGFDSQDAKKLDEYMSTVDAYYNADAQLNMLEQGLNAIRIDSIPLLNTFLQQTEDNERIFSHLKGQRFASKLDLDAGDPIQFKSHLGRVEVLNKDQKKKLEYALNNMHITYYLKGNDYDNWGNKEAAKEYYLMSIREKANYPPPYVALATYDLAAKKYQAALDTCKKVLVTMNPDTDTRYKAVKTAEAVIYVHLDSIKQQIEAKKFTEAIQRFEDLKEEARQIPGVKNFQEFKDIQELLYKGFYNQMVEQAQQAMEKHELLIVHQKIDSLSEFRREHQNSILNPMQEHKLLRELFTQWIEQGRRQTKTEPDSAVFSFYQAKLLCKKYEVVYCTEQLDLDMYEAVKAQYIHYCDKAEVVIGEQLADSALNLLARAKQLNTAYTLPKYEKYDRLLAEAKQLKYVDLIKEGDNAFTENQMREALAFYQEALDLESKAAITADTRLPGKILETAKNMVLLSCTQAESFAEALNLTEANNKYSEAKQWAVSYKITNDEEVNAALKKVSELVAQGKCSQALFDYNVQLNASQKFIEKHEFIYASESLQKAKLMVVQNPDCKLDASIYSGLYNDIRAMLHYQKRMIQIDAYIEDKEYSDAVEEYIKLTKFYDDSCTNNFGIEHKKLDDYFMTHTNTQFIDFGVRYYVDLGKIAFAMDLLHELRKRDYISGWSQASQEALGMQLALLDMEKNSELDPKIKVIDYTKNDKWYRFLRKSYLQQWKNR